MLNIWTNSRGIMLPPTATVVKVTNLLTPYIIRICEMEHYYETLNYVNTKVSKNEIFTNGQKCMQPKIGDAVLIQNAYDTVIDLPGWLCRGYISSIQRLNDTYNIFLIDYGISVICRRDDFISCSVDITLPEHSTFTVGLYNVLPLNVKYDSSMQKEIPLISDEWSLSAIEYAKGLLNAAQVVYFEPLVCDEYGRCYGEFYLNIKGSLILLSEALAINLYAIHLKTELLNFVKDPRNTKTLNKETINSEVTSYFNVSIMLNNEKKSDFASCYGNSHFKINQGVRYAPNEMANINEKIFIWGGDKYKCLSSTLDAKFPVQIHKAWKSLIGTSRPKKIQSYIWPAIQKGLNVVAIGPEKSGKTVGYAFAVCGLLATHSNIPRGINPSGLILCSSASKVLEVNSLCMELLQSYETIRSIAAINGIPERSLVAEMFNDCQILISTPRFLTRFMDKNKKLLNFTNLRYLILDDGDIILDKYFYSVNQLFKKYNIMYNKNITGNMLQMIVTASHWTPCLQKVASAVMNNPFICITSFVEAAIFKSIHPKVYIISSKGRNKRILDLLGDEYSTRRTMIVCRDKDEAEQLYVALIKYKDTLFVHENMNFAHFQGIKQYWNACISGSYPVLLCTDLILSDIDITNVAWLIHYSVSLRFRTQYSYRFSTLLDNLQMENCYCQVTVLMDESNDVQFLHTIKMMQWMNALIPQSMLEAAELVATTLEKKKRNYPICDNVKSWGFCSQQTLCPLRHKIISDVDVPQTNIRINDKVKFRVVSVHDVTHISTRIISYIKFDTLEEIEISNTECIHIIMKIQEFYSCVENRKRCEIIDVGCICGLEEPIDTFKRVQILRVERDLRTETPKYVDVRCIDNGVVLHDISVHRLLHMPEEIWKYSAQVMDVFLINLVPHDDEYIWNDCAIETVHQWFKENVDDESYVIGTVKLHLGNTIWVDTLEIGTKLIGYDDIIGSCLKKELLRRNHAVESDKHLKQMYQLCKDSGFTEINGCYFKDLV